MPTVSSLTASVRASRCLILRPRTSTRGTGATSAPPGCCGASTGMTPSTTRSICPETPPAGDGTSARTSSSATSDVLRMQFTVGEGIQNEMNDSPVDIGIENNLSNPVTPLARQAHTDRRVQRVPGSHLERALQQRGRLLVPGQRQHRRRRPLTPSRSDITRSATCSTTRSRT